jgi:hypothetical protein
LPHPCPKLYKSEVATQKPTSGEGRDVLTIKEAAAALGVFEVTLRRWDRAGKLRPHRQPVNGYRVHRWIEVLRMRTTIERGRSS